jgi:glycosyltransferase involved in cell wall biosynthesis
MTKILFIIPAFNEEKSIIKTVQSIKKFNSDWDVIVINDGSKDSTEKLCRDNKISIATLPMNLGIGGAVQTGYKYALNNNYDIAIQFDGDGQHNVDYVQNIIKDIQNETYDFIIGSRFIDGNRKGFISSRLRRIGIRLISLTIRILTGRKITDPTSGFRAANRKVIQTFADSYPIEFPEPESVTLLLKQKYRIKEVPVLMYDRQGGTSSIHTWKSVYYMINVLLSLVIVSLKKYK